ncbi:hypothetical protein SMNI109538_07365 [Smaragdicoccus niigatensis]
MRAFTRIGVSAAAGVVSCLAIAAPAGADTISAVTNAAGAVTSTAGAVAGTVATNLAKPSTQQTLKQAVLKAGGLLGCVLGTGSSMGSSLGSSNLTSTVGCLIGGSLGGQSIGAVNLPANGPITSDFGDGRNHQGIDIGADQGSPIRAATSGEVIDSGPAQGYGEWIRVKAADGTITTYGHNDTNLVSVGDHVTAGQVIGTVGNRGESTGPHLHFQVEPAGSGPVDPIPWLAAHGA